MLKWLDRRGGNPGCQGHGVEWALTGAVPRHQRELHPGLVLLGSLLQDARWLRSGRIAWPSSRAEQEAAVSAPPRPPRTGARACPGTLQEQDYAPSAVRRLANS